MKTKYGQIPDTQFNDYKQHLHSLVHWFLVYADTDDPALPGYFEKVQYKLIGLNELLGYPEQILEIMNLLESARLEYMKPKRNHKLYRRTILDMHSLVDLIGKKDE